MLIVKNNECNFTTVKFNDFGLSIELDKNNILSSHSRQASKLQKTAKSETIDIAGTYLYMAPEMLWLEEQYMKGNP